MLINLMALFMSSIRFFCRNKLVEIEAKEFPSNCHLFGREHFKKKESIMNRRFFITTLGAMVTSPMALASDTKFEVTRTDKQWRALLSEAEYLVMRKEKTERAGSSALNTEKRTGIYHCKGCDLPLYSSATKFDSGTGWPSFYEALPQAVSTKPDNSFFATRTEVHCRRCGSHLGHIFDDGPAPTGKRHCLNGVSLVFKAA